MTWTTLEESASAGHGSSGRAALQTAGDTAYDLVSDGVERCGPVVGRDGVRTLRADEHSLVAARGVHAGHIHHELIHRHAPKDRAALSSDEHGGIFSNDDDLAANLIAAGKGAGDPLWRFPLSAAYDKLIDSPIADIKNVGPREGGSITAAQFLQRFVNDGVKWAHLDIAGMVWASKAGAVWDKGATGYGVRLLDRFVAENFER